MWLWVRVFVCECMLLHSIFRLLSSRVYWYLEHAAYAQSARGFVVTTNAKCILPWNSNEWSPERLSIDIVMCSGNQLHHFVVVAQAISTLNAQLCLAYARIVAFKAIIKLFKIHENMRINTYYLFRSDSFGLYFQQTAKFTRVINEYNTRMLMLKSLLCALDAICRSSIGLIQRKHGSICI